MLRKLILVISVLIVGVFLFLGYQKIQKNQQSVSDIYSLAPINAIAIIEITEPLQQWQDLVSNNIIWEEFKVFEKITTLNEKISKIDSAFATYQESNQPINDFSILISIVPNTENETDETPNIIYQARINFGNKNNSSQEFLSKILNVKSLSIKEKEVFQLELKQGYLYGFVHDNIFSLGTSKKAIDGIANQIQTSTSLLSDKTFLKVRKTSTKDAGIRLFIHPSRLAKNLKPLASSATRTQLDLFPEIGSWIELDVDIKPDEVSMGGFITASDTSKQWLSLFENQEPIKPRMVKFLPNRTAFMMHLGFSDFASFREELARRKSTEMGIDYNAPIKTWDTLYDTSIETDFIQWIDNEIALIIIEPDQKDFNNDAMVWVSSSDAQNMTSHLTELCLKVSNTQQKEFYSIHYQGYEIHKLDIPDFISSTIGKQFDILQENYFTQIDDYIVFANSPATLQWTINRLASGKTLKTDPHYQSFENRISAESNIFIYSHIAGSPTIYQSLVNKELSQEIEVFTDWLQKFQVASIQISYENDDLYYINNYWRYNPVYKKESNSLWELTLDYPVKFKPVLVKNHYTNATEIFVQDTGNNIYLISNKGKVLWKRNIEETILSEVKQIDVYRNNKLQLAFNTANRIYIIDRNGKDLTNFPISLPQPASAQMAIMDYEKSKDYRFIIPTASGDIFNYSIHGGKTKGWDYRSSDQHVTQQVKHVSIKNKDYLISVFNDGSIKALDRRGKTRINFSSKFNFEPIGKVLIQNSSDLDNSYILAVTENKEVVKISLTDKKSRLFNIDLDNVLFIEFEDVDSDGTVEILASDSNEVIAYKTDGKKVFDFKSIDNIEFNVNVYKFEESSFIGYVSATNNKVYLSYDNGDLVDGFPMNGGTSFTISDINEDGRFNVITVNNKGLMFAYTLEKK